MTYNPDGARERVYERDKAERQALLRQLMAVLRTARERRDHWYVWVLRVRERRLAGDVPVVPPVDEEGRLL